MATHICNSNDSSNNKSNNKENDNNTPELGGVCWQRERDPFAEPRPMMMVVIIRPAWRIMQLIWGIR